MKKIIAELIKRGHLKEAAEVKRTMAKKVTALKWETLPKGWTKESATKFWNSLTGDKKHRITQCMKKLEGKVTDTGKFCGGLASLVGYR